MRYILLLLVVFQFHLAYSQAKQLPQQVRTDFCRNAILNYKYGSNAFKAWMIQSARNTGITSLIDIEVAVNNICSNKSLQDEFFKNIFQIGGGREFIFLQFTGINMTAENAKTLTDYLITKYSVVKQRVANEEYIDDTLVISKHKLLKSIYPKGTFENDSVLVLNETAIRTDSSCYLCKVSITTEKRVVKQFMFAANSSTADEDSERLLIVLSSTISREKNKLSNYTYSAMLFKKEGDGWSLYELHKQLVLTGFNVSDVEFKIEDGNNFLLFVDESISKAKFFNVEDLSGTTKIDTIKKVRY